MSGLTDLVQAPGLGWLLVTQSDSVPERPPCGGEPLVVMHLKQDGTEAAWYDWPEGEGWQGLPPEADPVHKWRTALLSGSVRLTFLR